MAQKGKNMDNQPSTGWDAKSKEDKGIKFRNPKTLEEVIENFDWLPRIFGWTSVQTLVFRIYSKIKLLKSQDEFKQFCIKYHALTIEGKIGTAKTLKGDYVAWAYPMFAELWNITQKREATKEYAEQKSWDELSQMATENPEFLF